MVALLFVALIAPLFIDWTGFRQEFEDQASRIVGKKVVVHGAVDARFIPFPSVTLHDVRVGAEADGTPLVQVAEFSMDAELAPFLSGEALIYDMRISRPKARIRLLKDGRLDWMRGSKASIPARTVVLENVRITDGDIEFIDEQSGRTRRITGLDADMSAKSLAGPWRIEGSGALDGEKGRFTLSTGVPDPRAEGLRLKARILPESRPVGVDLEGALTVVEGKPSYRGAFTALFTDEDEAADKARGAPRLKGQFELTNEKIRVPDYRLELGDVADPYVITGEATLDTGKLAQFLLIADGQQIDVNRLNYDGARGKTGRDPALTARKRFENLLAIAAAIPVPQVPGRASLKLPAIVAGDTAMRDIRLDVRPDGAGWLVDNAVAVLPGRTQVEAKGRIRLGGDPGFDGTLLVASTQPSGLSSWMTGQVAPALRGLKTAGFSARASLSAGAQRFDDLELILGPARLTGTLQRERKPDAPPALTLDLAGNAIDLDALTALAGLFGGEGEEGLAGHQISAKLKADAFTAWGVTADHVETAFTYAGNALSFERLTAGNVAGAALTAIGRVESGEAGLSGSGRMTVKAEDPTDLFALIRDRLPAHPALDRLVKNAGWYANSELKATLALGGKQGKGFSLKATGTANGSIVNLDLSAEDMARLSDFSGIGFAATLENPQVTVLAGQAGLDPLPIDSEDKGLLSVTLAGKGGNRADLGLRFTARGTALTLKGNGDMSAPGFLSGSYEAALESEDLEPYLILAGVTAPGMGTGLPARLSGTLAIAPEALSFTEVKGAVAANQLDGALTLSRQTPGWTGTGTLALAEADLGWLAELVYGPVRTAEGGLTPDPMPKLVGGDTNLTLDLTARLMTPGIGGPIRNFAAALTYSGDQIVLSGIKGTWSGGALTGTLTFGNGQGSGYLQSRLNLADADTAALSWQVGGVPVIGGGMGLDLAVEATGPSVADLAAALSGSGQLQLKQATVRGLNLDILNGAIAAADLMGGEISAEAIAPVVESSLSAGQTALGDLAIPFTVTGGKVIAQNIPATVGAARLEGSMEADLAANRLAAAVTVTLDPGAEAQSGAEPQFTLSFAGAASDPGRTLDVTALSNFLSLRAFEKERLRVERLQAKLVEKQRLRRETMLYAAREAARRDAAQQARENRLRAEAKARAEAEARVEAEKAAAEKAAAEKAAAEKAAQDALDTRGLPGGPLMPVSPDEAVTRGQALPPPL